MGGLRATSHLPWRGALFSAAILGCFAPPSAAAPSAGHCRGIELGPDSDLHAALAKGPEGATFCFTAGLYRLDRPLQPKRGQRLNGAAGAVLSGAKPLTGFAPDGPNFVATGFLPPAPSTYGACVTAGCSATQDVFLDGTRLTPVADPAELAPGAVYRDFVRNKVHLRDDPAGRSVEQAFAPALITSSNGDVTIEDFVVEKAAGEAQVAAVRTDAAGWVVQYNEVRLNHGQGINCGNCVVRGNFVHHNGQLGMGGQNGTADLVEGNEISYNNTAGYDPAWEGGGAKWWAMKNLVVRGNYVHHNHGPGLWTDTNNKSVTYERNYVSANDEHGIFHEISYAATIRDNIVVGNGHHMPKDLDGWGGVGIRIAASPNVEVARNRLHGNRNGVVAIQQVRTDGPDPEGPHEVDSLRVHDNDVSMTAGVTGLVQDVGDPAFFTTRGNRFSGNHYHLDAADAGRFAWQDATQSADEWRRSGNDTNGTFDTTVPTPPGPPTLPVGPRRATREAAVRHGS